MTKETSKRAIIYAGPHFGRPHRIIHTNGSAFDAEGLVRAMHELSGDVVRVHPCDIEFLEAE